MRTLRDCRAPRTSSAAGTVHSGPPRRCETRWTWRSSRSPPPAAVNRLSCERSTMTVGRSATWASARPVNVASTRSASCVRSSWFRSKSRSPNDQTTRRPQLRMLTGPAQWEWLPRTTSTPASSAARANARCCLVRAPVSSAQRMPGSRSGSKVCGGVAGTARADRTVGACRASELRPAFVPGLSDAGRSRSRRPPIPPAARPASSRRRGA